MIEQSDNPQSAIENPQSTPPPAAATVATGKTEREINLELELAEEKKSRAKTEEEKSAREQRIAELEAELSNLKAAVRPQSVAQAARFGFFGE